MSLKTTVPSSRNEAVRRSAYSCCDDVWRAIDSRVSTDLADLIRRRRTSMLVDKQRDVPSELIRELCELAQWAPNHKRTWPWRFAIAEGPARARLGKVIADAMQANGDPPEKVEKTRTKYMRTPVTLVVGSAPRRLALADCRESRCRRSRHSDPVARSHRAGLGELLGFVPERRQRRGQPSCAASSRERTSAR